jgi:hypothetical protein
MVEIGCTERRVDGVGRKGEANRSMVFFEVDGTVHFESDTRIAGFWNEIFK